MATRASGSLLVDISPLRDSPAFRRLFVGRTIMLFGVGMVAVTVQVHVYLLSGSTVQVGVVSAVEGTAFFLGYMFGGVLSDRSDRWRLIQMCRWGSVVSFLGLTVNAALGGPVWLIAVLVAVNGLSGSTGITALLAVLPVLVGRTNLHAVGALNTLSLRLGSVLAPVAGGTVVAAVGPVWSYGLGALAALITTPLLRRPKASELPEGSPGLPGAGPVVPGQPRVNPFRSLVDGYRHILRDRVVLGVMAAGLVGMLGGGSRVLMPALADARFGHAPLMVGLMYSALSAGVVLGTLGSGWIKRVSRSGRLLLIMMIVCFLCYAAAGASPVLALALVCLLAAGAVNSVEEVLRYALLQLRTPEEYLGRVNSAFAAQNMSGVAVGALVGGLVGAWVDPVTAFWGYNLAMAGISVLVLFLLPSLRRHRGDDAEPAREAEEDRDAQVRES